jgi:branched-chain amino acid transport system ATP-binding protein
MYFRPYDNQMVMEMYAVRTKEAFDKLRAEIAMVIVDHHLDLALALSDRTVVLERGAVTWRGASHALRDDRALRHKVLWL